MLAKGELVVIRYPGLNMYTIMKKNVYEASPFGKELIFEFSTNEEFICRSHKKVTLRRRYVGLPKNKKITNVVATGPFSLEDDDIKLINRGFLFKYPCGLFTENNIYIEQPNGNLILIYEPSGGFIV